MLEEAEYPLKPRIICLPPGFLKFHGMSVGGKLLVYLSLGTSGQTSHTSEH